MYVCTCNTIFHHVRTYIYIYCDRLSAAAASTLEELKTQGRAGLEHAISQRKVTHFTVEKA